MCPCQGPPDMSWANVLTNSRPKTVENDGCSEQITELLTHKSIVILTRRVPICKATIALLVALPVPRHPSRTAQPSTPCDALS